MKVYKFGGTSVGTAKRIKSVADLIRDTTPKIVVLSAMAGTTDKLTGINDYLYKNNFETANELIFELENNYFAVIEELYQKNDSKLIAKSLINTIFETIKEHIGNDFNHDAANMILAQGEMISTGLFDIYLKEINVDSYLLPATDFMKTNQNKEPDFPFIKQKLNSLLEKHSTYPLFITQGFVCRNVHGSIDNLQRGGSDYTASIIGATIEAEEIQIWTDIDGIHNNDPRYVDNTRPVPALSFDEAAELAYFGAKILHPSSILPAKFSNIPVRLKNTMEPRAEGTVITKNTGCKGVRAIAAKDGITRIRIESSRMLLAHGFLRKVFEIFENYETSIDMITTSEVGVSLTIDNPARLNEIVESLKKYGTVNIEENQSIICVVGYLIGERQESLLKIIKSMQKTPIQMISYGGSNHNVSFLIPSEYKKKALNDLHNHVLLDI